MIPQRGVPQRNNAGLNKPAPFLFYSLAKLKRLARFQRLTPLIPQRGVPQWGVPQRNNARLSKPAPFLFYSLAKLNRLAHFKTKNAPLSGSINSLQRERDSNPRYVAIYTLSKRAPSATRPPLYFIKAAKNKKKIELEK